MNQNEISAQILELEKEIALLPVGSITKKKIKDKDYYYHRVMHDKKRFESYISFDDLSELKQDIEKRKELEKKLKELKKLASNLDTDTSLTTTNSYKTIVRIGNELKSQLALVQNYKKRECYQELKDYIFSNVSSKVFILYGLRRTGKTTLIRQVLNELDDTELNKAAYIQIKTSDTIEDIYLDLKQLEKQNYKYIFIDEVTLLDNFIENASIFSDIFVSSGMKIVLSGTDSLGFAIAKQNELYDRCILLHTTFIPYREFERVLGIHGIDEYIRYGGTMSLDGINYNSTSLFSSSESTKEYIDTAIAKNIQHSLNAYEYGGHFMSLYSLYEKGELTNVINRVIENINHEFTIKTIEQTFKSHDLSVTASNLLKDKKNPIVLKEHMDIESITSKMMVALEILNKENQSIPIETEHLVQIKEYLKLLDLINEIDLEYLPTVNHHSTITVITQPGLRYAQAKVIVENLLLDEKFKELNVHDRQRIIDRLLSEVRGRMMEEIILLETSIHQKDKHVFKLQFPVGEFDMVVQDKENLTCEIYEIKHSTEKDPQQYRHLIDEEKCDMTEFRYGTITSRYVIYRGETTTYNGIHYLNVEEYLKSL